LVRALLIDKIGAVVPAYCIIHSNPRGDFAMRAWIIMLIATVSLTVCASLAIAQQDRYTLKLGNLAFSDFRGYENWKVVAVSQTDTQLKVIVANDVMIAA